MGKKDNKNSFKNDTQKVFAYAPIQCEKPIYINIDSNH